MQWVLIIFHIRQACCFLPVVAEATRLYAKYVAVVDEMRELFVKDVAAYLNAVRERMQAGLETGKIGQEETKEYRTCWIEDEDTNDDEFVTHVWLERRDEGTKGSSLRAFSP